MAKTPEPVLLVSSQAALVQRYAPVFGRWRGWRPWPRRSTACAAVRPLLLRGRLLSDSPASEAGEGMVIRIPVRRMGRPAALSVLLVEDNPSAVWSPPASSRRWAMA